MNMHAIREFSPGLPIKIESREDGKAGSKKRSVGFFCEEPGYHQSTRPQEMKIRRIWIPPVICYCLRGEIFPS